MSRLLAWNHVLLWTLLLLLSLENASAADNGTLAEQFRGQRGICVLWEPSNLEIVSDFVQNSEYLLYYQATENGSVKSARALSEREGWLGKRVYVESGPRARLHLADNLADVIVVGSEVDHSDVAIRTELTRVLHPGGRALAISGETILTKAEPTGSDDWSHPYHGPDNNPQSRDQNATAPYLTQFLTDPWYVPMPEVTVASGGRVFKAFGHIALKEREWPWLNTLVCINGYNGIHQWKRTLEPGFMIHRNTLIATPNTIYLADARSCRLLDTATGETRDAIKIPQDVDPDGVWKWMALSDGVLFALVGAPERPEEAIRGTRDRPGWPWSELGRGYAESYAWGFGRTLVAIDPQSHEILWSYQSSDPIDSRALCLAAGRIFLYSQQKFFAAVDQSTGQQLWKTTDESILQAIGQNAKAQNPRYGFSSSAFAKANSIGIFFAGPQRDRLVAISAQDGSLMWDYPHGNFQLVLRDDALYALGRLETSKKFDYSTGAILADLDCYRGNCTRATATIDSIFTRGYRHTGTMRLDVSTNEARRIPLMRPGCQDGVVVASGHLYWGPWMCDCNHSLVGMICLAPAGSFDFAGEASVNDRLEQMALAVPKTVEARQNDWPMYRSDAERSGHSPSLIDSNSQIKWKTEPTDVESTAPVTVGGLVFWGGLDGIVHAADAKTGNKKWTAATGGAIRFSPEFFEGRLYVGSGDGWIYCLDAGTGQTVWRFRAAPIERRIPVHGRLLSTWPVASGVLIHDGIVYAAAGISSYDGTHLFALDAETGDVVWHNNSSGRLVSEEQVTGVSVQGHLLLHKNELFLAGGNVVSPARYRLSDGKCLNELSNEWWERPENMQSRFPTQQQTESSTFQRAPRGRELFVVDDDVRVFDQLLYSPPAQGSSRYFGGHFLQSHSSDAVIRASTGRVIRIGSGRFQDGKPMGMWESPLFADPRCLALCENVVIVAGQESAKSEVRHIIAALAVNDGKVEWKYELPAEVVSWGMAVDHSGHVAVTLRNGQVVGIGN